MATISLAVVSGSGNETNFILIDDNGDDIDLDALDVSLVSIKLNDGRYSCSPITIDSDGDHVSFSGNVVTAALGQLCAEKQSQAYYPEIDYVNDDNPNGIVVVAKGFETQIKMTVV